jgi:N utilization substance protein B
MQTIYTVHASETEKTADPQSILSKHFDQTRSLFIYLTWFLSELCRYAEADAHRKASKHLPTSNDLNVNIKIAGNEVLWKMLEDPALQEQFKNLKPGLQSDPDLLRKIYLQLIETKEYREYISQPGRDKQQEKKIIEFILNDMLLANELFVSHIEELYTNWDDDGEMVVHLLAAYITKPGIYDFNELMTPDKRRSSSKYYYTQA